MDLDVMHVIYVTQEITNLNKRYIMHCPKCNLNYGSVEAVNQFITTPNLRELNLGLVCKRCREQYRITLKLKLPIVFNYGLYMSDNKISS